MRPLVLLQGFFLRLVLSALLWGCEPNCPAHQNQDKKPIVLEKATFERGNSLVAEADGKAAPVALTKLLGGLVRENGSFGILVLECGSEYELQWLLSSSTHTMGISGMTSSKESVNGTHKLTDGIYSVDAQNYATKPKGLIVVSPGAYLSFRVKNPPLHSDCVDDALLFAIIYWNSEAEANFPQDITFVIPSQCTDCPKLLLSDKYIRVCPRQMKVNTVLPTTARMPTTTSATTTTKVTTSSTTPSTTRKVTTTVSTTTATTTTTSPTTTVIVTQKKTTKKATTTTATTTTTTSTKAPTTVNKKVQARFTDDLRGLQIRFTDGAPTGIVNCSKVVGDLTTLGKDVSCNGDGREVAVNFGADPVVNPGDQLRVKTASGEEMVVVESAHAPMHPFFVVDYKPSVMRCEPYIFFVVRQVAGTGDRLAKYHWKLIQGPEILHALEQSRNGREVRILTKMIATNFTLTVKVCNFAGECVESGDLFVEVNDGDGVLSTSIDGIADVVHPSTPVRLTGSARFSSCNSSYIPLEAQFFWNVSDSTDVGATYRIPYDTMSTENSTIPVSLYTTYKDPKSGKMYIAETDTEIKLTPEPLALSVDAARRSHPVDANLIIDASASNDPNGENVKLKHSWSCFNVTAGKECILPRATNFNQAVFQIPGSTFQVGQSFRFDDLIKSPLGQHGTVSCYVVVAPSQRPSVSMVPLEAPRQSIHDYIRLIALVSSDVAPTDVQWEVIRDAKGFGFFNLDDFIMKKNSTFTIGSTARKMMVSLTIPPKDPKLFPRWPGLAPNSRYLLRLTASNAQGASSADVDLKTKAELPFGAVEVVPNTNLTGLNTDVTVRLGDGWGATDSSVTYRFGYKVLMANNHSEDIWLPRNSLSSVQVVVPSGSSQTAGCKQRIGFKAQVEICDKNGLCKIAQSPSFEAKAPGNISVSINDVMAKINVDVANGNVLEALPKMNAISMEMCEEMVDTMMADKVTLALTHTVTSLSDVSEWYDVVEAVTAMLPYVSSEVIADVQPLLDKYRSKLGLDNLSARRKRAAEINSLTESKPRTEKDASDLLGIYDVLLNRGEKVVDVLLANVKDFLADFCLQLDEQSTRIMKAQGINYTSIQAQTVNPSIKNFLNTTYSTAGSLATVRFSEVFQSIFKEYSCGANLICHHVCLATARIADGAFSDNVNLEDRFYTNAPVALNRSVSAMHRISIIDPSSGSTILPSANFPRTVSAYTALVPISTYRSTDFYACYIYTDEGWDSRCNTSNYAIRIGKADYMRCQCLTSGYLAVYSVAPPAPPSVPLHSEIEFFFYLNTSALPTPAQTLAMVSKINALSGQNGRLVDFNCEKKNGSIVVSFFLRPPFKLSQMSNAYALQAVTRAADPLSGFYPYEGAAITKTSFTVIQRKLIGDGNARKVVVRFDGGNTYASLVGNSSDTLASKWTDALAVALRVSPSRFKNAGIYMGVQFNFTITKPFEGEKSSLSAEEISLMLVESSNYNELQVANYQGDPITIPPIVPERDLVELRVIQQSNSLVTILIIVLSTGVFITLLYIGGAVMVKVRTDRFMEEERRRMLMMEQREARPPNYNDALTDGVIRTRHS